MFNITKIEVWSKGSKTKNSFKQVVYSGESIVRIVHGDVQPYSREEAYKDYGYTVECVKRVYIDKIELSIDNNFLVINGTKYEITKIPGDWEDYLEVLVNEY